MSLEDVGPGRKFGSYEILEELGRGGMGRVYLARHVPLQREVALKLLAERYAEDEVYVQRFLKEARAAACLNHPNIVQIYDFGQVGSHWYLAMEYVDGRSLAGFLTVLGRFAEWDVITLARQVLTGLAVAHAAGIVHRDIKPDNLILGGRGIVKLVDLGLAKRLDDTGASFTGFAAGTPHYISPEQVEGRSDVDGRADLYSLGATLYQLATGRVPFPGPSSVVIMSRHLNERAPDPRVFAPELSEGFCAAVLRLMARERARRPGSAEEAEREFAALQVVGTSQDPAASTRKATLSVDPAVSAFATADTKALAAPSAWGPEVCRRVEEALASRIGPLAHLLVRMVAKEATSFEDLCRRLAEQIPDETARPAFLKDVLARSDPSHPSGPGRGTHATATPAPKPASNPSGGGSSSGPSSFPPALLAAAEQRLAAEIGPLARILVKQEAKRQPTWGALVEALSAQVPDEAGRRRLREALGPLGV